MNKTSSEDGCHHVTTRLVGFKKPLTNTDCIELNPRCKEEIELSGGMKEMELCLKKCRPFLSS